MKKEYVKVDLEVILFSDSDVIATSAIDDENNWDTNGWT